MKKCPPAYINATFLLKRTVGDDHCRLSSHIVATFYCPLPVDRVRHGTGGAPSDTVRVRRRIIGEFFTTDAAFVSEKVDTRRDR
jgi:hypothetical protein